VKRCHEISEKKTTCLGKKSTFFTLVTLFIVFGRHVLHWYIWQALSNWSTQWLQKNITVSVRK